MTELLRFAWVEAQCCLFAVLFVLWAAEDAATFLRAWQYPSQESVWTLVHAAKLGSWSLLVVVSIVLVAAVKAYEGKLYGGASERSPAPSAALA